MTKNYESKFMYRVFYWETYDNYRISKEAYFTHKEDAARFAKEHDGILNRWAWEVQIEEMA